MGQLLSLLLLVGFIGVCWKWIAAAAAVAAAIKYGPRVWERHQAAVAAEQRRLAATAARADQQHAWALAGDPRGTYGGHSHAGGGNRIGV